MQTEIEVAKLRDRVIQLEAQVAFLYRHLGVTYVPESSPVDDPRIIEALKKGNKLEAIKLYRQIFSTSTFTIGADEASRAVDEIKGRLGL
ncbi:MAG TPA: hypothetical protein VMT73_06785 [Anaerolineales bacterium]|nr:hypothetical protein [Anaerolineales bacterium]